MAAKDPHGLDIYDLLIEIIFSLSPKQAKLLYNELLPRYTKRAKTKFYNSEGEQDPNGRIRLMECQYKSLRVKNGDTFIKKAFRELDSYIKFLEDNQETSSKYKAKLRDYNSKTHINLFEPRGWVYEKCKEYICTDRPKIQINPYLIDDFATATAYVSSIPKEIRDTSLDVQMLLRKFPELLDLE